jgi:hypothetical protein
MQRDRMRRDSFSTFIESLRGVDSVVMMGIVSPKGDGLGMAPEWVARR